MITRLRAICAGETDRVVLMAEVAGELFHAVDEFDWVGFYRVVAPDVLTQGRIRAGMAVW